ncbi:Hypothetical protein DHA2_153741 [Giardia duodenalis]|uniref:Reverse transcriptase/endonuclease n=1 Tax=Giardia intestinalis TaxID=5741 RepID=V6T7B9_GIAIN|nr:Hypothetical protein DHA2_153741 [Giardia intestinalis]
MVNYAPLVEIASDKADYEELTDVAQSFSKITNRSCDRLVDFLAYPKEKGGLGLLMPGFYHDELRRAWASLDVNRGARDPVELSVDGQALQGKGTYFNRLLTRTHQLSDRAATYCLQMCGVLTEEERALKEKGGSIMAQTRGTCPGCHTARTLDHDMNCPKTAWTRTARHDMIVTCLYLRVSGKFNAELEVKTHSHLSDQNQKPDIWLVDKCKAVGVGVIQPRQMDAYYNEKVKKYRDVLNHLRDGWIPPPQSKGHLEELHVDLCPGCLRHRLHGCRGERAPDEADQTRPGRKPGHPERPSPVILLLTTE